MGKDPAVLFYCSDFMEGTRLFSYEEKGKYITLLCDQKAVYPEHLPKNHMITICGSLSSKIIKKFSIDSGGNYFNERMEYEIKRRIRYCDSRSNNKSGRKKKKSYDLSYENHMDAHMGNGNRKKKIEKKEGVEIPVHLKEIWPDFLEMRKRIRKPATDRAQKNIITKLASMSNDESVQISIVEQSITKSWQDVFPLNGEFKWQNKTGCDARYTPPPDYGKDPDA